MSNAHPSTCTGLQNSYKYHKNYIYSTINNKKKKKNRQSFFSVSRAWTPPPHRQTRRKFPGSAHGYTLSWLYRNDIAPKNLL